MKFAIQLVCLIYAQEKRRRRYAFSQYDLKGQALAQEPLQRGS